MTCVTSRRHPMQCSRKVGRVVDQLKPLMPRSYSKRLAGREGFSPGRLPTKSFLAVLTGRQPPSRYHGIRRHRATTSKSFLLVTSPMKPRKLVTHGCPIRCKAVTAHACPESLVLRTWSPGPACTSSNREMVVSEREDGRDGADEKAKDDVEAVMSKIEPT